MQFGHGTIVERFSRAEAPDLFEQYPTPWGQADAITFIQSPDGYPLVAIVETPSHGGMIPHESIWRRIPEAQRAYARRWAGVARNGIEWFEEDVCAAFVIMAAPELFADETVIMARAMASFAAQRMAAGK